jgi:DNA-binding response OmpR family regulator
MPVEKTKILIVDHDFQFLLMIQQIFELVGLTVITADNGETALTFLKNLKPSLVLLDVPLPDIDSITICKRIREFSRTPIIIISNENNAYERVEGIKSGADDYLTKPFYPEELIARVKAALRRALTSGYCFSPPLFRCQDLEINFRNNVVTLGNKKIELTPTEYHLLSFLIQNNDRVVSSSQILEEIWRDNNNQYTHVVRVYIGRLRRKLNDEKGTKYIKTRPGQGYILYSH